MPRVNLAFVALVLAAWTAAAASNVAAQSSPEGKSGYSLLTNASPKVGWSPFEESVHAAAVSGKKVLVDIFAPSCGWCRRMQEEAYMSDAVLQYLDTHFETARLDIEVLDDSLTYKDLTLSSGQLAYGFGATGTPTTVFLMPNGDYITRLPGYAPTDDFLLVLKYIATDAFLNQTFEDFAAALVKEN